MLTHASISDITSASIPQQRSESREDANWSVAHDFMFAHGGAERVTAAIARGVFSDATVRVIGGDSNVINSLGLNDVEVMYRKLSARNYTQLAPLYARMLESRSAIQGNLVCSSYGFAHHLRAEGNVIVYCHSPLRQIWSGRSMYAGSGSRITRSMINVVGPVMRSADRRASRRARHYIANSQVVAERIKRFYNRSVDTIIAPPVNPGFQPLGLERQDLYVWAGRIVEPYKRLEMTIEAFRGTNRQLVVAGAGRDEDRLRALAPANVRFVGHCDTAALATLYASARALVFPSEDDFGMVPIEAMSCGTPVIAYGAGGALETVKDGVSGVFFEEQTTTSLNEAIDRFERSGIRHSEVVDHAQRWNMNRFVSDFSSFVSQTS